MRQSWTSEAPRTSSFPAGALSDLGNEAIFHFGWDTFAHAAELFSHPRDVLRDPHLTREEKREILASWASDACAVEAAPALRQVPGGPPVLFDDVMEALRAIDEAEEPALAH
jgi:hypothetical protein